MERKTYTLDASNRAIGRISTEIVALLRGKNKPDFAPNKDIGDFVVVKNINQLRFTGNKLEQKKYYRHSGYLGGLKEIPMKKIFESRPEIVLQKTVLGMLPKNKLRALQIKRLKIEK